METLESYRLSVTMGDVSRIPVSSWGLDEDFYLVVIEILILDLLVHRQENKEEIDLEGVLAMHVFNFMRENAIISFIAHKILTEMRFAKLIFLIQQTEEESNVKKFLTGLKFVSLLCTLAITAKVHQNLH